VKVLDKIQYVGIGLVIIFQLYHYIAVNYFATSAVYILPRSYFPVINHFQAFFAGILFYKIKNEGATWLRHLMIFLCYLGTMALFRDSGKAHYFISFPVYAVLLTFYYIVFYLFVYGRLGFIAVTPLLVLGQISYSLYLVHGEAGKMLHPFLCNTLGMNAEIAIVVILCVMILISYIVTFYIEQPVIGYIRKRFLKRPEVGIKEPAGQYMAGKVRYSEQEPVCK
jgi:peptidoglycan/LPS O-acetylase OafA/YrhL